MVNGEFPKRLRQEHSKRQIGEFVARSFPLGENHQHVGAATNYTSHSRPQEPAINEVRTDGKEGYELPDFVDKQH